MPPTRTENAAAGALKRNQACHQCRKRKQKCDAGKPCSPCIRSYGHNRTSGAPICTYDEDFVLEVAELKETNSRLQHRIDELESALRERDALLSSYRTPPPLASSSSSIHQLDGSPQGGNHSRALDLLSSISASTAPVPSSSNYFTKVATEEFNGAVKASNGLANLVDSLSREQLSPDPFLELLYPAWPTTLPPPAFLNHLVEVFLATHPSGPRILHRPTFLHRLCFPPTSPHFPHRSLLHAICAVASFNSSLITQRPRPDDVQQRPPGRFFPQSDSRASDCFGEEQARFSKESIDKAVAVGDRLFEVFKANIILTWWYNCHARWAELWSSTGICLRYSVSLELNICEGSKHLSQLFYNQASILGPPMDRIEAEERVQTFWLAYTNERLFNSYSPFAMSLADEDISQFLPVRLEDYENGRTITDRQKLSTPKLLTVHPPHITDTFTLYLKGAILMAKVSHFNSRWSSRSDIEREHDPRDSSDFKMLDSLIAAFRLSFPPEMRAPISPHGRVDVLLYAAHLIPFSALINLHGPHTDFMSPNCRSSEKVLNAARAILDLVHSVCSTSFDLGLLDPVCCSVWCSVVRVFTAQLRRSIIMGRPEETQTAIAELEVFRLALQRMGERMPLGYRQVFFVDRLIASTVEQATKEVATRAHEHGFIVDLKP